MAGKKNKSVVAPDDTESDAKKSDAKEPASQPTNEFISEKNVRLTVLALVVIIIGYFGYPFAKTWVSSLFVEEEEAITTAEVPVETIAVPVEEPAVSEPSLEEEIPLEVETPVPEETIPSDIEQNVEGPTPTMEEPVLDVSPTDGDTEGVDEDRFSTLEAEITTLKEELSKNANASDAGVVHFASAVAGMAPPLYQSRAFVGELEQVRILILGMPALDQAILAEPLSVLSNFSRTGVPDSLTLEAALKEASLKALREEGLTETSGWWARTWARIKGLVVIRRTDIADSSTLEGAILQMENAMKVGDIRTALDVLGSLNVVDAAAFEGWAKLARGRVQALEAFEKLINFIPQQQSGAN